MRIIAATNQDLMLAVAEKRFRQDLYYRLNVARFQLPPLRERREDIPVLVSFFLEKYYAKMGVRPKLHDSVLDALAHYDFPGNIRELEHMIEQAVALAAERRHHRRRPLAAHRPARRSTPAARAAGPSPTSSTRPSARPSRGRSARARAAGSGPPRCWTSRRRRSGAR